MRHEKNPLTPNETAALTRLVIAYCLGRGSICLVSRSISLQIAHPLAQEDYIFYKWRRLCQYLPRTSGPKLYDLGGADEADEEGLPSHDSGTGSPNHAMGTQPTPRTGQWRLRVGSRHFAVARNLLYPDPTRRRMRLTSEPLELVGAEGIAALWSDRGRIVSGKSRGLSQGRLNLARYDWAGAGMIRDWMQAVVGVGGQLLSNPRMPDAPMLYFDHEPLKRLVDVLSETWMAQAACLRNRFHLPEADLMAASKLRERISREQRLADRHQQQLVVATFPTRRTRKRRGLPIVVPDLVAMRIEQQQRLLGLPSKDSGIQSPNPSMGTLGAPMPPAAPGPSQSNPAPPSAPVPLSALVLRTQPKAPAPGPPHPGSSAVAASRSGSAAPAPPSAPGCPVPVDPAAPHSDAAASS